MAIDESLRRAVAPHLEFGERLLWAGRPSPWRLFFGANNAELTICGLIIARGFYSTLVEPGALKPGTVLPLCALAILAMLGLLDTYWSASRTVYAVTTQRLLVLISGKPRSFDSYTVTKVSQIEREERPSEGGCRIPEHPRCAPR